MTQSPTIAEPYHDLIAIKLVCGVKTHRHSKVLPLQTFADDDTVITIGKGARCTKCGGKSVNVAPRWRKLEVFSRLS